ncbi:hypothetical protein [Rubinisphaera margarita]|uniref:hypothetical protein n=1 Tax=Rubinisphaera margarita TaxID=2909586 RepID=UPI001EE86322|nr:hypothetical protein [Rubinisphaera margarita]MCG6157133.1 hypothetical protein [Rubinisphaera margarita]
MRRSRLLSLWLVLAAGCLPPVERDDADRKPADPKEAVIREVFDVYQRELRALLLDVSAKLETGELSTELETNRFIQEQSRLVREEAFQLLNEDAAQLGGEGWSPERAAAYWKKQGEAL